MSITRTVAVVLSLACTPAGALAQQPRSAGLSGLARDLTCAPASPAVKPTPSVVVAGGREHRKSLFGTGDALLIRGGTAQGLKPGDEFFVRRIVRDRFTEHEPGTYPISISTAGTVQIVEAQQDFSIAIVVFGCDGIVEGDYLEPYQPVVPPSPLPGARADYAQPGRLILGAERRQTAAPGEFMVIDRGSGQGLQPGQQLTIFRRTADNGPVATVGTATVYSLQPQSSVVRIDSSQDAIYVGDLVAVQR
jgi:hypothetical protein